jgi:hypothetical protein
MESILLRVDRTLNTLGTINTHESNLNDNVSNYLESTDEFEYTKEVSKTNDNTNLYTSNIL